MAKYLLSLFSLIALAAPGGGAFAVEIKNLPDGWTFQRIAPETFEAGLTGAQGAISLKRGEDVVATILVFEKSLLKRDTPGKSLSYWRSVVLPEAPASKRSIQHEGLFEPKAGGRYIVEYSTDTGSETMLQSAVMAQKSGNGAIELRFENHRRVYQVYSQEVLRLYRQIKID